MFVTVVRVQIVEDWRNEHLLRIFDGYKPENIHNADETGLFLRLPPNKMLNLKGNLHWWKDLHKGRTLLLGCIANVTYKIPSFITGNRENLVVSKMSEFAHTHTHTHTVCCKQKGWVSQAIFTGHLRALDVQLGSKNRTFLHFGDRCAACQQIT